MKKLAVALLMVAAIAAVLAFAQRQSPPAPAPASLRHAPAGTLIGFAERHDTYAWLGIPYAQAPVGALRWRAPLPLPRWQDTRKALAYGALCPQFGQVPGAGKRVEGSEDCLTLNVWTPRLSPQQVENTRLPVMVWIHGGGNTIGSSQMGAGFHLAGTQNVVVVSLNYRLGVFGWLSHPALRDGAAPEDASGNYGLLDQIAALRWVRDNIAAFGGDPANITLFGESAGARDVLALLVAPPAQGLFQRAIAQSGSLRTEPVSWAENFRDDAIPGSDSSSRELINRLLIAESGGAIDRAAAMAQQQKMSDAQLRAWLHAKSPEQLLAVTKRRSFGMYEWSTNLRDGAVLPIESLFTVLADPSRYQAVPIILGSNRDESKLFMSTDPELVDMRFGFLPKIKDLATYNHITGYFSDAWKALAVDEPADVLQKNPNQRVFVYRFDWDEAPDYGFINLHDWLGAAHGLDIPFVLGDGGSGLPLLSSRDNRAGREQLTEQMMSYWATFARDGNPGDGGRARQPLWEERTDRNARQLIFATARGGGVRMDDGAIRAHQVKQRLNGDNQLSERRRCEMYVQLFLINFHSSDFWSEPEYQAMGCGAFAPREVKPAS